MRKIAPLVLTTLVLLPAGVSAAAMVNINTADAVQLDTLPGIGPSKAAAIVDYRTAHGPFARIEDIQNVKGIGPSTFAGFKSLITVNAAATSVQPTPPARSSNTQQTVTHAATPPAKPTSVSTTAHENAPVSAPGTTSELVVPGALVADAPASASAAGMLSSPWTTGFLGVVVIAGAALMIL